jgi:hypothetical protein
LKEKPIIYFVFPYRGVGGVSILFLRLAHTIATDFHYKCVLVDYRDGYMATRADVGVVSVIHYEDSGVLDIYGDSIVVFQSMTPWSMFPGLSIASDVRVLFWNCHPANLVAKLPGFRNSTLVYSGALSSITSLILRPFTTKLTKFVQHLLHNNGLVFMDHENVKSTEESVGFVIDNPVFIPIPAERKEIRTVVARENGETLHFCWIGRIVNFKYFILKRLLDDLSILACDSSIKFKVTIVGDGSHLPQLKAHCNKINTYNVNFVAHLEESSLDGLLVNDVDILFAMGTSALEGAKYGVPTILLDIAYSDVPATYVYRWLYSRDGSTLGDTLRSFNNEGSSYQSLKLLMDEFLDEEEAVSQRTYAYFEKNHSMEEISARLLDALGESRCLWGDLKSKGLLSRGLIYPLFKKIKRIIKR